MLNCRIAELDPSNEWDLRATGGLRGLGRLRLSLSGREDPVSLPVDAGLEEDFGVDDAAVERQLAAVSEVETRERSAAYSSLRRALEPGWNRLLTQFNGLPEGVKFLVDLRADLSRLTRKNTAFR